MPITAPTVAQEVHATLGAAATKTLNVTVQTGDLITVWSTTNNSTRVVTPSGGSLTWTVADSVTGVSARSAVFVHQATATSDATFNITCTANDPSFNWQTGAIVWRGHGGVGAVGHVSAGTTPQVTLTTTVDKSAILFVDADFNGASGTSRTWVQTAGTVTEVDYAIAASDLTSYAGYYGDVAIAGSKTVGLSAPAHTCTSIAVEIKSSGSGIPGQPLYRTGTNGLVASGTLNLTVPATTQTGDVMLLSSVYKSIVSSGVITTPSGWTPLGSAVDMSGAAANAALWMRTAAGTPGSTSTDAGATVALVPTAGTQQLNADLAVYAYADPTPRDWGFVDKGATSSLSVVTAAETTVTDDLVVHVGAVRGATSGVVSFTGPVGTFIRQQTTATSGGSQDVAAFLADSTTSGAKTFTASRASWAISGQVVLAPSRVDVTVQQWKAATSGSTGSPSSTTVNLDATATAGNTLLVAVNSDSTVTTPTGYTLLASSIHNAGCYLYGKIAAGSETGVTVSPTSAAATCVAIAEVNLQGGTIAAQTDKTVSNGSSTGATTRSTGTTATTAQADEYTVAVWGYSASQAIYPNGGGGKWSAHTNSFTERVDVGTVKATGTNVGLAVAELRLTSTGTVESTASTGAEAPPSESLAVTLKIGAAGGTDATATPSTVAAVAAIAAPTVTTAAAVPATVAAVAAIPGPTLQAGAGAAPATVNAVASIAAPTLAAGTTATPATVAATAAIPAPTMQAGATATPATVAAVASVPAPTVTVSAAISAATVAATATIPAPTVQAGAVAAPATVQATATIPAPTVTTGAGVTASTVTASASIPTPTVSAAGNVTISPATVQVVASTAAPAVSTGSTVAASTVNAVAAIPGPTVKAGAGVSPATVNATAAVPQPSVSASGNITITPPVVNAVASVPAPSVGAGAGVSPATVAASAAIPAPSVSTGQTVPAVTVQASASIPAPVLAAGVAVTATTVQAAASIPAPVVTISSAVVPATVQAVAAIGDAAVRASQTVTATTVAATASIPAPTVSVYDPVVHRPNTGTVTRPGGGFVVRPNAGLVARP